MHTRKQHGVGVLVDGSGDFLVAIFLVGRFLYYLFVGGALSLGEGHAVGITHDSRSVGGAV